MDVVENEQLCPAKAINHWYYHSKYKLIRKHLDKLGLKKDTFSTADVGTGIGLFLSKMEADGLASPERSVGIDPAHQKPIMAIGSSIPLVPNFPQDRKYDLVLMMDVLEHVENDVALLSNAADHTKTGGFVFITVPALPYLYSAHDRFLGHYRRYTLKSLRKLIDSKIDLEPLSLHYYFASLLPIAAPWRLLNKHKKTSASDMKALRPSFNFLMKKLCSLELEVTKHNKYAGLTAVALCRKK
jgi:SAM-dependent methyltransferase